MKDINVEKKQAAFPTCYTSNIKFGECQTFIGKQRNVFHGACDGATSIWIHTRMSKVQEETEQCLPWRMRQRHLNIWFLSLKVQMTSNYGPCLSWNDSTTLASQPCDDAGSYANNTCVTMMYTDAPGSQTERHFPHDNEGCQAWGSCLVVCAGSTTQL